MIYIYIYIKKNYIYIYIYMHGVFSPTTMEHQGGHKCLHLCQPFPSLCTALIPGPKIYPQSLSSMETSEIGWIHTKDTSRKHSLSVRTFPFLCLSEETILNEAR